MSDADARSSPRFDALWRTVVSEDANLQAVMRRVAETGRAVLADCESASITIIERGRPVTVGSSNDTAQALDDAQYSAGEGPCLAAAQEGRTIRIDDTGNDERWPRFVASARANGIRSSLSVPIDVEGADTFAGFNVYGNALGGFSDADAQLCQAFAAQASIVVANAQAYFAAFELSRNMAKAMESRAEIEQAKGVLISTHRIDADAAFDLLRQRSQTTNRKLRDVAVDVVNEASAGGDDESSRS
jgi:GAF domain-containing protein